MRLEAVAPIRQRQNSLSLRAVIERMEAPDFIQAPQTVKSIEVTRVAGCKFARLEIATSQVCIMISLGTLSREKMKLQPATVGRRDPLRFSEKCHKQKKNQISIHLRLQLKIPDKIFRRDVAHSPFKLERGV